MSWRKKAHYEATQHRLSWLYDMTTFKRYVNRVKKKSSIIQQEKGSEQIEKYEEEIKEYEEPFITPIK